MSWGGGGCSIQHQRMISTKKLREPQRKTNERRKKDPQIPHLCHFIPGRNTCSTRHQQRQISFLAWLNMSPTKDVASLLALTVKSSELRVSSAAIGPSFFFFFTTAAYPWLNLLGDADIASQTSRRFASKHTRHFCMIVAGLRALQRVPAQIIFGLREDPKVPRMQNAAMMIDFLFTK